MEIPNALLETFILLTEEFLALCQLLIALVYGAQRPLLGSKISLWPYDAVFLDLLSSLPPQSSMPFLFQGIATMHIPILILGPVLSPPQLILPHKWLVVKKPDLLRLLSKLLLIRICIYLSADLHWSELSFKRIVAARNARLDA